MNLLIIFLIGISLSLDAFSLALSYGLINVNKTDILYQSIIVGLFHFFMPLIGSLIGNIITITISIPTKYITVVVFIILIIDILKSINERVEEASFSLINMFLFGLAVSIDSFSVGITIKYFYNNIIICSIIFMFLSFIFTFVGFHLGKFINKKIGYFSKIISAIILTIVCIYSLI